MPTNQFLAFGTGVGANVMSQADYENLAARLAGWSAGVASSAQINKAIRQSASMSAMLGKFMADIGLVDANDDGNIATLLANFLAGLDARIHDSARADLSSLRTVAAGPSTSPPGSPTAGMLVLVADSPSGAFSGQARKLALYDGAAWRFTGNVHGRVFRVNRTNVYWELDSTTGWRAFSDFALEPAPSDISIDVENRIVNGEMRVNQRHWNDVLTIASTGGVWTLDRWLAMASSANRFNVGRFTATPPAGLTHYLRAAVVSAVSPGAADYFHLSQPIEASNFSDAKFGAGSSAQKVHLSFLVRSSVAGTYGGSLQNSDHARSYPFTFTINAVDTWEKKEIPVVGDQAGTWLTGEGVTGLWVNIDLGSGANFNGTASAWASADRRRTSDTVNWISTAGATFDLTGVDLRVNGVAKSYRPRPAVIEQFMCLRYYFKTYPESIKPGTLSTAAYFHFWANSGGTGIGSLYFPVVMAKVPTFIFWNPTTGATGSIRASDNNNYPAALAHGDAKGVTLASAMVNSGYAYAAITAEAEFSW